MTDPTLVLIGDLLIFTAIAIGIVAVGGVLVRFLRK